MGNLVEGVTFIHFLQWETAKDKTLIGDENV